jgi:hypothetical protein
MTVMCSNDDQLEKKDILALKIQFENHHEEILDKLNNWLYV